MQGPYEMKSIYLDTRKNELSIGPFSEVGSPLDAIRSDIVANFVAIILPSFYYFLT